MIDTVLLESPELSDQTIDTLQRKLKTLMQVTIDTGTIHSQFTKDTLLGSYDSRISLQLRDYIYTIDSRHYILHQKKVPIKKSVRPFLRVECSLHKQVLGHNCFGGSDDLISQVTFLLKHISDSLEIVLPSASDWKVLRLDYAKCYDLGSFEAVESYIRGLSTASYSRRKVDKYAYETIYVPGRTTTLKFYHKGPEFLRHDFRRISQFCGDSYGHKILDRANRILRVECEFKQRKLEQIFAEGLQLSKVDVSAIVPYYDLEVSRLLHEAQNLNVVRTSENVLSRLNCVYSSSLASTLFSSWVVLSTMGEKVLRKRVPKATFFRHRKQLQDAGCSWNNTDLHIVDSLVPSDFSPLSSDSRCMNFVHPRFYEIAC